MCSRRGICSGDNHPSRSSSSGTGGSGAHYALCALGVGLIALGIVMIVWTVIPGDGNNSSPSGSLPGNSTAPPTAGTTPDGTVVQSSTVVMVLAGVGVVLLLLSLCLGIRSKREARNRRNQPAASGGPLMGHVAGREPEPTVDPATYNVPSYEEVVGSNDYPVRQSNLRNGSQLPSYEDIIAAVENEGAEPRNTPAEDAPLNDAPPAPVQPASEPGSLAPNPSLPTRSSSRASRLLRPLRVRRIKSDKLHLKDFRLQIRTPTQNPVTIEPITPPPQYENKMPELQ